jgi:hypothetical protein
MITDIKVIENFYSNPKQIIELAFSKASLKTCITDFVGQGKCAQRSIPLFELDSSLYNDFCDYICFIHSLDPNTVNIWSYFSYHEYNIDEAHNIGVTHIDGRGSFNYTPETYNLMVAGQIFLSEKYDYESGFKFYSVKEDTNWTPEETFNMTLVDCYRPKEEYFSGKITLEEMKNKINEYDSKLNVTADVKNVFNRMVSWKAGTIHSSKITEKQGSKLTQNFFISRK